METVSVKCPVKDCDKALVAEVTADLEKMTKEEKKQLLAQVRAQLLKAVKKHHKEGHPRS